MLQLPAEPRAVTAPAVATPTVTAPAPAVTAPALPAIAVSPVPAASRSAIITAALAATPGRRYAATLPRFALSHHRTTAATPGPAAAGAPTSRQQLPEPAGRACG